MVWNQEGRVTFVNELWRYDDVPCMIRRPSPMDIIYGNPNHLFEFDSKFPKPKIKPKIKSAIPIAVDDVDDYDDDVDDDVGDDDDDDDDDDGVGDVDDEAEDEEGDYYDPRFDKVNRHKIQQPAVIAAATTTTKIKEERSTLFKSVW